MIRILRFMLDWDRVCIVDAASSGDRLWVV